MKKLALLALVLVTFLQSPAIAETKLQAGSIDPAGTIVLVDTNGLVCDFCARTLEKLFMKRSEVSGVDVNLTEKRILISLRGGKDISDDDIRKTVTDAGYAVAGIRREPAGKQP